jgi:hypothetical protein
MQETTRQALIPALGDIWQEADELKQRFYYLCEHHQMYQDKTSPEGQAVNTALDKAYAFTRALTDALKALKNTPAGAQYVRDSITSWYRGLHWDMPSALVEIDEADLQDPVYESVEYKGQDVWVVVMTTTTHGRERLEIHGDGATWCDVYSCDKVPAMPTTATSVPGR